MKTIENKSLLGRGNSLLKRAVEAVENDSSVCGSHIKIGKIIMSFPARCFAFVRGGIFAPARVLKKHSSCRFLDYIGKSCLMREITTSHSTSAPRNDEPYPTTSRLSSLFKMTFPVVAFTFVLSFVFIGGVMAAVTCANNQTCGTDCCWVVENGTLKITGNEAGTGVMKDYYPEGQPWYSQREGIMAIEVSGIKNLGNRAFQYLANATTVTLSDSVKSVGNRVFFDSGITSVDLTKVEVIKDSAFFNSRVNEWLISDTLSSEMVEKWANTALKNGSGSAGISNIRCVDASGNDSSKTENCIKALERFLPNEDGICQNELSYCLKSLEKINNSCVGRYFAGMENDGTCITKKSCVQSGNVIKFESRECMSADACKETYAIDSETHHCNKIAGCSSFANGACVCDKYYYKKEAGCVSFEEGCGSGWLEKKRECIKASDGCGNGYKDLGGWCNRVIYTPAEAAPLLEDENNTVTITFRK